MPGSLGVESMHQMFELWCVHAGHAQGIPNPTFDHDLGKTMWKYRGQFTPKNDRCDFEVHIKTVEKGAGSATITADGYFYVDKLRVYEVKNLRLRISSDTSAPTPSLRVAAPPLPLPPRSRPEQQRGEQQRGLRWRPQPSPPPPLVAPSSWTLRRPSWEASPGPEMPAPPGPPCSSQTWSRGVSSETTAVEARIRRTKTSIVVSLSLPLSRPPPGQPMRFSILRLARGPLSSMPMRTGSMPMRMRLPGWPAGRPACPCPRGCGM